MYIPKNMTEAEVMETIENTINNLLSGIRPFGYYSKRDGDLKQQAWVYAIEALSTGRYDESRPLGGFLRTCIINKFISLSRDKFRRTEIPCTKCPFFDKEGKKSQSNCLAFDNRLKCPKYKVYHKRNQLKMNIMNLKADPIFEDTLSRDYKPFLDIENREFALHIREQLTIESKVVFDDLINDRKIKKVELDKLRLEVYEIIKKDKEQEREKDERADNR